MYDEWAVKQPANTTAAVPFLPLQLQLLLCACDKASPPLRVGGWGGGGESLLPRARLFPSLPNLFTSIVPIERFAGCRHPAAAAWGEKNSHQQHVKTPKKMGGGDGVIGVTAPAAQERKGMRHNNNLILSRSMRHCV